MDSVLVTFRFEPLQLVLETCCISEARYIQDTYAKVIVQLNVFGKGSLTTKATCTVREMDYQCTIIVQRAWHACKLVKGLESYACM